MQKKENFFGTLMQENERTITEKEKARGSLHHSARECSMTELTFSFMIQKKTYAQNSSNI